MSVEVPKPPLTMEIQFAGETRVLRMTYGLDMDIRRLLPDPRSAVSLILHDQYTQDFVVRRMLTDKKGLIKDESELIPAEDMDISTDDVEAILQWVLGHVLYFFTRRAAAMQETAKSFGQTAPLPPSNDGSEISASSTPSAGPSESSKET